tara:strand:- start:682 stop:933 length:252 start_codon:yes stop_codon:yes gene_type:complete
MIKIYTTNWCPSCVAAKNLFAELNLTYKEINIEEENMSREDLQKISGNYTVPQIIINYKCIGGYTELLYLHQNNELNKILNNE